MLISLLPFAKRVSALALVVSMVIAAPTAALAQSPSPGVSPLATPRVAAAASPSPSSSPSADTTEKLKARIDKIVEEKKSQIMGALSDLRQERRGFIGEIQRVSAETITLKTSKGVQILSLTPDVAVTRNGQAVEVKNIAVGDWAMVIGRTEDDTFKPELIDISSASLRPKTHLIALGTLTDVTRTAITFQAKNQTETQKLNIIRTSEYEDREGKKLTLADIEEDQEVLLIGQQTGETWELGLIRVLTPLE